MSQITLEAFQQHLKNIYSSEEKDRVGSLQFLLKLCEQSPDIYMQMLTQVLKSTLDPSLLSFAAVHLGRKISVDDPNNSILRKVNGDTLIFIEKELTSIFLNPPADNSFFVQIVDAFGDFLAMMCDDQSRRYGIMQSIGSWAENQNEKIREGAILLLANVAEKQHDYFSTLVGPLSQILMKALNDQSSIKVKHAAIISTASILSAMEKTEEVVSQFQNLAPSMIQILMVTLSSGDYERSIEIIKHMIDIIDRRPSFFAKNIADYVTGMEHIATVCETAIHASDCAEALQKSAGKIQLGTFESIDWIFPPLPSGASPPTLLPASSRDYMLQLRNIALEFVIVLCSSLKKQFKKWEEFGSSFTQICLTMMYHFKEDPKWAVNDDYDDPDETIERVVAFLDSVSKSLGGKYVMKTMMPKIQEAAASPCSRMRVIGLLALTAVVEGASNVFRTVHYESLLEMVMKSLQTDMPALPAESSTDIGLAGNPHSLDHLVLPRDVSTTTTSSSPRVLSSAIHLLAALIRDIGRDFTMKKNFLHRSVEFLSSILTSPQLAAAKTIRALALRCFIDIAENSETVKLAPELGKILETLTREIRSPESDERVIAIQAMVATIDSAETAIIPFFQVLGQPLFQVVDVEKVDTNEDRKFQAHAIEALASLLNTMGKERAGSHIIAFTEVIFKIFRIAVQSSAVTGAQTAVSASSSTVPSNSTAPVAVVHNAADDSRLVSIRSVWPTLASLLGGRFAHLLNSTVPILLDSAKKDFTETESAIEASAARATAATFSGGDAFDNETINLNQQRQVAQNALNERERAMETLSSIIVAVGPYYAPFIPQTLEMAFKILGFEASDQMTAAAADSAAEIVASCIAALSPQNSKSELHPDKLAPMLASAAQPGEKLPLPPLPDISVNYHPVIIFCRLFAVVMPLITSTNDTIPQIIRKGLADSLMNSLDYIGPLLNPASSSYATRKSPFILSTTSAAIAQPLPGMTLSFDTSIPAGSNPFHLGIVTQQCLLFLQATLERKAKMRKYVIRDGEVEMGANDEKELDEYSRECEMLNNAVTLFSNLMECFGEGFFPGYVTIEPVIYQLINLPELPPPKNPRFVPVPGDDPSTFSSPAAAKEIIINESDRTAGLYLMAKCIALLGASGAARTPSYMPHFLRFATVTEEVVVKEHSTRQNAVAGILAGAKYGGASFSPFAAESLKKVVDVVNMKIVDEDEDEDADSGTLAEREVDLENDDPPVPYLARDTAVSCLAVIAQYQKQNLPRGEVDAKECLRMWFDSLPLVHDDEEAVFCHDLLCNLIETNDPIVFGGAPDVAERCRQSIAAGQLIPSTDSAATGAMIKLVKILMQITMTKFVSPTTDTKFQMMLKKIRSCLSTDILAGLWQSLPEKRQSKLFSLFNS